jgi:dihydroneopterin aldolase
MGQIFIPQMRFHTKNGVFAEEKKLGQLLEVDVTIDLDIEKNVKDDDLNTTISYASVYEDVSNYVSTHNFNLIESLANGLLELLQRKYSNANFIEITIRKYSPPVDGVLDHVQIMVSSQNG